MTDPQAIIAICTRCGVTSWQNVARQLGRSVDSVRAQFDPGYERAYVWAPSREPIPEARPEDLLEPTDVSSPYAKGPGLKAQILCLLNTHGAMTVETLAGRLNRTKLSIRKRLNDMRAELLVCNDSGGQKGSGAFGWTWRLCSPDGSPAKRASESAGVARGFNQRVHLSTTADQTVRELVYGGRKRSDGGT